MQGAAECDSLRLLAPRILHPASSSPAFRACCSRCRRGRRWRRRRARFASAAQLDEQELTRWLVERGGHATTAVELPGEFSLRGGILDIFAPDADDPVRIELFGDEVESIRRFEVATQRSLETLEATTITMLEPTASDRAHFTGYLPAGTWFCSIEPNELGGRRASSIWSGWTGRRRFTAVRTTLRRDLQVSVGDGGGRAGRLDGDDVPTWSSSRSSGSAATSPRCATSSTRSSARAGGVHRLPDRGRGRAAAARLFRRDARSWPRRRPDLHFPSWRHLKAGFRLVPQRVVLVSGGRVVSAARSGAHDAAAAGAGDRQLSRAARRATSSCTWRTASAAIAACSCWRRTARPKSTWSSSSTAARRSIVPASKIELVQKYVGGTKARPTLANIGGTAWVRAEGGGRSRRSPIWPPTCSSCRRPASSRPGIAFPRRHRLAARVRRVVSLSGNARPAHGDRRDQSATCSSRGRWTGCCAATSASARPSWRCGRRSRRSTPATRWRCSCRRRCWPSSTRARSASGWPSFRSTIAALSRGSARPRSSGRSSSGLADGHDRHRHRHAPAGVSPTCSFTNLGLVIIDEEQRFGVEVKERLKALRHDGRRADDDGHADPADAAHVAAWACATSRTWKRRRTTGWRSKRASRGSTTS